MALKDKTKATIEEKVEKVFGGTDTGSTTSGATGGTMGFDDDFIPGLFKTTTSGSEYVNKFTEKAKELFKEPARVAGNEIQTRIFKLDNNDFMDLPYSYVILASKSAASSAVYYHVILLEATGRKPVQVSHILEEIKFKNSTLIYVAADTFADPMLRQLVNKVIVDAYGVTEKDLRPTEGLVVPYDQDPETVAVPAAVIAYNANVAKLGLEQGIIKPINLPNYVQNLRSKNGYLQLDVAINNGVTINAVGKPIRADFELDLYKVTNVNVQGIMPRDTRKRTSTVVGYMEYLPEDVAVAPGVTKKMFTPMIILDEFHASRPTSEMTLLSIINSATFSNPSMLLRLLTGVNRDLGVLNVLANMDQDKSGYGKKIKLKDGKLTDDKVYQILTNMVQFQPIVAIEIENFGPNFGTLAPFAALAVPGVAAKANDEIVKTAELLLGQQIQNRQVAANDGIVVPVGEWVDNTGTKRDIREIDLAFVLDKTNDINLVFKWIMSNVPGKVTGMDPYLLKLEVINALIPNAVITGKAVRIPLNAAFVSEIVEKAMAAGYNPKSDIGQVGFTNYNNLQAIAAAYGNAKMQNINFGYSAQPQQYYTPNVGMFGFGGF